jgi:hypothetical protein
LIYIIVDLTHHRKSQFFKLDQNKLAFIPFRGFGKPV